MKTIRLTAFTALMWVATVLPAAAGELHLRQSIVIDTASVNLSDVFDGAGETKDLVIAAAPAPGRKIMFRPTYLAAVARKAGHLWRIPPGLNRVVVTRGSNLVPMQDIQDQLNMALTELVKSEDIEVQIAARRLELHVDRSLVPTVSVEDISYDPRSRRFRASLLAPADDPSAPRVWISGRVHSVKDVPVLVRRVSSGTAIKESDLSYMRIRSNQLSRNIVVDAGELVGLAPRRPIQLGRPIRATDLKQPETVRKGDMVTMTLVSGKLTLSAIGRALGSGAAGDIIPVLNVQSHKTVQAAITNPGQVRILLSRQLAANAN